MPMQPDLCPTVPEETARVAHASFPNGHPYLRLRDACGVLFTNAPFAPYFHAQGRPAEAPARLALVSLLQFAEGLSDRQAADAVRSRLDWKYLLGLSLTDPGFDASVLSTFRARLVAGGAEALLFTQLLEVCRTHGWLKPGGPQRTDATHVLAAVRALNRLELVGETFRSTLNALATAAPTWLLAHLEPAWAGRYARPFEEIRLPRAPRERQALAETIGQDGFRLLTALAAEAAAGTAWAWLPQVPAVEFLRQVWLQQFDREDGARDPDTSHTAAHPDPGTADPGTADPGTADRWTVRWRPEEELPPAALALNSPYDAEARWGRKGDLGWLGYKVHLTETCAPERPHLLTDVQTTPAPTPDPAVLPAVQTAWAERDLAPTTHLVDGGYVTAARLVESQAQGIDLCGPTRKSAPWQVREGGFTARDFQIDWKRQQARCPGGQTNHRWYAGVDAWGTAQITIVFPRSACAACALRAQCTRAQVNGRTLTVRPPAAQTALEAARHRETTDAFQAQYAARAGVEGTVSQGVRRCDLRRSRYVGQAKTRLQHYLIAAALNLVRVAAWLCETPHARTRQAAFLRLAAQVT